MKQNTKTAVASRKNRVARRLLEALEQRAYLSGVVFGAPQTLSDASAGLAPVYANLDNISSSSHADLIIANNASGSVSNSVSILPGNGDGTFGAAQTIALSFQPLTILDGQLGTNGKTDIVLGSHSNNTVGVVLQASNGSFAEQDYTATGLSDTQSVAIGDFGNGLQDIAVASDDAGTANNVAIFFNNGDGTFTLHQVMSVPHTHLASLTSFTAGGTTHLAVADQLDNQVTVLLNNGSGTFSTGNSYNVGGGPVTIKSGPFDKKHNTNDDLVTANSTGGGVSVLLGNGDGTFNPTAVNTALAGVPAGGGPLKVRVANLTNSGNPDLIALLGQGSSGSAEVLLGQGDGTFHLGNVIATSGSPNSIAAGDINGDGLTDMTLAGPSLISTYLNITSQDTTAPTAAVSASQPTQSLGAATITFNVTYTDAQQVDTTSLNSSNVTVTGPGGQSEPVTLVSTNLANAATVTATYSIPATGGSLSPSDNGTYSVTATSNTGLAVKNANDVPVAGGAIGTFAVNVSLPSNGPNLTGTLTTKMPAAVVGGTRSKGNARLTVTNSGNQLAKGTITIDVYASPTQGIPATAPVLTITKKVNLKPGKHASFGLPHFVWPSGLNGAYYLVANIDSTHTLAETNFADNVVAAPTTVTVAPPFVDVQNAWNQKLPKIVVGKHANFAIQLVNNGNVAAKDVATITISASPTGSASDAVALGTATPHVNIGAGKRQTAHAGLVVPTLTAGTYHVIVTVSFPGDTNAADKTVVSSTTFTV